MSKRAEEATRGVGEQIRKCIARGPPRGQTENVVVALLDMHMLVLNATASVEFSRGHVSLLTESPDQE